MSGADANPIDRLPHADPFLFLTRVLSLEAGVSGVGEWELTGDEDFFRGHFPGHPLVPGVLLTEAAAQLSGLVAWSEDAEERDARPDGVRLAQSSMKFPGAATPPATLTIKAHIEREIGPLVLFRADVSSSGVVVAEGTLTLARMMDQPRDHA